MNKHQAAFPVCFIGIPLLVFAFLAFVVDPLIPSRFKAKTIRVNAVVVRVERAGSHEIDISLQLSDGHRIGIVCGEFGVTSPLLAVLDANGPTYEKCLPLQAGDLVKLRQITEHYWTIE